MYQDTGSAKKYMWNRPKQTTAKRKPHQQPDQPCTLTRMRGGKRQRRKSSVQLILNLLTPSHPILLCWKSDPSMCLSFVLGWGFWFVFCVHVVVFMCVCFNFVFMDTCWAPHLEISPKASQWQKYSTILCFWAKPLGLWTSDSLFLNIHWRPCAYTPWFSDNYCLPRENSIH